MKIYVIVVTYNGKKWYDRCFDSLLKSSVPINIVAVDNASSDNTIGYLLDNYPSIYTISVNENVGFAKANNIAIKYALKKKADYVFLLNQDAWVERDTIATLLKTFEENDNVGIASPMHLNGSYTGLDKGFCEYVAARCFSDMYFGKLRNYYSVPMVNAAAWLISKECLQKVGGFDISLFKHYGEDDNYAQRVLYHGMKIIVNTKCTICHDREQRIDSPTDSPFNVRNSYYHYICQNSNVLLNLDMQKQIRHKQLSIIKSIVYLQPKKIRRLRKEISIDRKIAYSRKINMSIAGGLEWLVSN